MSFPLKELSSLIGHRESLSGVVVQAGDGTVRVATQAGAMQARTTEKLTKGERVIIRSGWAERAPSARQVFAV